MTNVFLIFITVLLVALAAIEHVLDLATEDVGRFEEEFIQYIRDHQGELLAEIRESGDLSDENTSKLNEAIGSFKSTFRASAD